MESMLKYVGLILIILPILIDLAPRHKAEGKKTYIAMETVLIYFGTALAAIGIVIDEGLKGALALVLISGAILVAIIAISHKNESQERRSCLLIGRPGSGAKSLYEEKVLEEKYSNVFFFENIYQGLQELFQGESVNSNYLNRFDCIIICGHLNKGDLSLITEFLFLNFIESKRHLSDYVPMIQSGNVKVAVMFERKRCEGPALYRWKACAIDAEQLRETGSFVKV